MNFHESNQNDIALFNVDVKPIVSIIVATYRRDISLEKALLSLINQTYKFLEIIVVDDNADEFWNKTVDLIISKITAQTKMRIIYIKNDVNKGSAETRNTGIAAASGEYVTFLDDDDLYFPDKVKNQIVHIIERESDFSITDLCLYDENDKLIEIRNRSYIKRTTKSELLKYHLMYHMTGTDTMMFKRDYLLSIGGFPAIDVGDEFYLMLNSIMAEGKFSYLPTCDIKAFVHTNTNGLSSGESKINGENILFNYKKQYFKQMKNRDIRYIRMRHYAVLAFAEIRRKNILLCFKYSLLSFCSAPISFSMLIWKRR